MRTYAFTTFTFAGLLGAIVAAYPADPALAKKMTCSQKYDMCSDRCISRAGSEGTGAANCRRRTCNPQYRNCIAAE